MHPTDGAMLAKLDGWDDPLEHFQVQQHIDGCGRCWRQMESLKRGRLVVAELLRELDRPVPARFPEPIIRRARQRRNRWRALTAATIGLFLGTAAGATIRNSPLHDLVRWLGPPELAEAPARRATPAAEQPPTAITLQPTDDVQIEFATAQDEGELRIVLGSDPRVTVTASEPVPLALRSGKVAIANDGARASYRVALPRGIERAAIRVAGRVIFAKRQSVIATDATREQADSFRVALAELRDTP